MYDNWKSAAPESEEVPEYGEDEVLAEKEADREAEEAPSYGLSAVMVGVWS